MSPEQALPLANDDSPVFGAASSRLVASRSHEVRAHGDAFRTGEGVGWREHDHSLFHGTERFFRPGYLDNLVGVASGARRRDGQAEAGARVADVGCGYGASTIIMAQAFPKSQVRRLRLPRALDRARARAAAEAGLGQTSASRSPRRRTSPASGYDLVASSTASTTWATPSGRRGTSARPWPTDGTWLLVEPFAGDRGARTSTRSGGSTTVPRRWSARRASLAQEVGLALGAQAGEKRLARSVKRAASPASAAPRRRRST